MLQRQAPPTKTEEEHFADQFLAASPEDLEKWSATSEDTDEARVEDEEGG